MDTPRPPAAGSNDAPGGGILGAARREQEALSDVFDSIISRTLSEDSEAFLSQTRQRGGQ